MGSNKLEYNHLLLWSGHRRPGFGLVSGWEEVVVQQTVNMLLPVHD